MPYDHTEGAYPLGRWLSDQRRAYRTRTTTRQPALNLEQLGIVWNTTDAASTENLTATHTPATGSTPPRPPRGARRSSTCRSGSG
ncbi:hypothetical protein Slala02_27680 [Streptomyces lavendulae subsp. lavendulae]|nr:hypothetical protein Slala01_30980 [Streptomyces lavendulae subsp. lavendulae]GLX26948.1 hypothetical protein Slala02_27680 [Streptomyces lavendulae subsp. lavendulae]